MDKIQEIIEQIVSDYGATGIDRNILRGQLEKLVLLVEKKQMQEDQKTYLAVLQKEEK